MHSRPGSFANQFGNCKPPNYGCVCERIFLFGGLFSVQIFDRPWSTEESEYRAARALLWRTWFAEWVGAARYLSLRQLLQTRLVVENFSDESGGIHNRLYEDLEVQVRQNLGTAADMLGAFFDLTVLPLAFLCGWCIHSEPYPLPFPYETCLMSVATATNWSRTPTRTFFSHVMHPCHRVLDCFYCAYLAH